jgi:hypothetical protein
MWTAIQKNLGNNVKFTTKHGYFGLSEVACQGDLVAVLAGCRVPVILRRNDSHFELVGICFVLDLRDGQAWTRFGEASVELLKIF